MTDLAAIAVDVGSALGAAVAAALAASATTKRQFAAMKKDAKAHRELTMELREMLDRLSAKVEALAARASNIDRTAYRKERGDE